MAREIWYTADVVTPDGSDTGVYGDGCEPGCGATLATGWIDPSWSGSFRVYEEAAMVRPDTEPDQEWLDLDEITVLEWTVKTIHERIGWVEDNHGGQSFYACDPDRDNNTGAEAMLCAHLHGYTDEEEVEVWRLILAEQRRLRGLPVS